MSSADMSSMGCAGKDLFDVMIKCPSTGRGIRTGVEVAGMEAFDSSVGRTPTTSVCPHCLTTHIWTHRDAWLERQSAARTRQRTGVARPPKP